MRKALLVIAAAGMAVTPAMATVITGTAQVSARLTAAASNYVAAASDIGNTLTVSVVAKNAGGSSAPASSLPTSAVTAASGTCPFSGSGWPDGCPGSPTGTPLNPNLLDSYGVNRPPWNVAGVDYHVGVPDGAVLTDWQTLVSPNLTIDRVNGVVTVHGGDYDFENIDFSLGVGATINNAATNNTITINNCIIQPQASNPNRNTAWLISGGSFTTISTIIITNSNIDGTNMGGIPSLINASHNITLKYNYFKHSRGQILQYTTTVGGSIIYQYNFIDDTIISCGMHCNYQQLSSSNNSSTTDIVSFNTTYQHSLGGAEGFQFYYNLGTGGPTNTPILLNPVFENNTMIAIPHTPGLLGYCTGADNGPFGPQTMSYMTDGGKASGTPGGMNKDNYFGIANNGAYGAYYPGKMTPAQGWTSSGNIAMSTGAANANGSRRPMNVHRAPNHRGHS